MHLNVTDRYGQMDDLQGQYRILSNIPQ